MRTRMCGTGVVGVALVTGALCVRLLAQGPPAVSLHAVSDVAGGPFASQIRDVVTSGGVIYAVGSGSAAANFDTPILWTWNGSASLSAMPLPTAGAGSLFASALTPNANYIASQGRYQVTTSLGVSVSRPQVARIDRTLLPGSAAVVNLNASPFTPILSVLANGATAPAASGAVGVSDSGTILYGFAAVGNGTAGSAYPRAFRWDTASSSSVPIPIVNAGDANTIANRAVSADGSVAVGSSFGVTSRAFRYVHGTGITPIPFLPEGTRNTGLGVTPDGNIVLVQGDSAAHPNGELYLYDATTGAITELGSPNTAWIPGGIPGMTADATVVAATFVSPVGGAAAPRFGYIHNGHGWFHLTKVLADGGVDLAGGGWTNFQTTGISRDGTLIFGSATHGGNIEGFVAEFPADYLASYHPVAAPPMDSSIVGVWANGPDFSNPTSVTAFLADGTYFEIEANGFERGLYTYDGSTLTATTLVDTNGDSGLSGANGFSVSVTLVGDTLSAPGEDDAHRITTAPGSLVGGWVGGDPTQADNSRVFIMTASGKFFFAEDGDPTVNSGGRDGVEVGMASWDLHTLTPAVPLAVDTNGEWGLSHASGPITATFTADELGVIAGDSTGTGLLTRIIDPKTVPAIVVTSPRVAGGIPGAPFSYTITASRAVSFDAAGLPSGLSINPVTGVISGTTTEGGTFNVIISATNTLGDTVSETMVLVIGLGGGAPELLETYVAHQPSCQDCERYQSFRGAGGHLQDSLTVDSGGSSVYGTLLTQSTATVESSYGLLRVKTTQDSNAIGVMPSPYWDTISATASFTDILHFSSAGEPAGSTGIARFVVWVDGTVSASGSGSGLYNASIGTGTSVRIQLSGPGVPMPYSYFEPLLIESTADRGGSSTTLKQNGSFGSTGALEYTVSNVPNLWGFYDVIVPYRVGQDITVKVGVSCYSSTQTLHDQGGVRSMCDMGQTVRWGGLQSAENSQGSPVDLTVLSNSGTNYSTPIAAAPPGDAPPVANAGSGFSVGEGHLVTLDGTRSIDPDGDPLSYEWMQLPDGSPIVTLSGANTAQPTFTAPAVALGGETLTFTLTVTARGQSSTSTVSVNVVNVNHAPVAEAGSDQSVAEGSPVTLDGSASFDVDADPFTYAWVQKSGPTVTLSGADAVTPSFAAPYVDSSGAPGVVATLVFELRVDDGDAADVPAPGFILDNVVDTVTIQITNVNNLPTARAGDDQTVDENTVVSLSAAGSTDPDSDTLLYNWSQTGGPSVAFTAAGGAASFTAPFVGAGGTAFTFSVTADDGYGGTSTDTVIVHVQNANDPPLATAARPTIASLWPPNHGMAAVGIAGVSDPNGNARITITRVSQDEPTNGLGDGDAALDAVIEPDGTVLLRAERSGGGDGRVYHVHFTASDPEGSTSGVVTVSVPPNARKPAVDGGELFDSTN